MPYTERLLPPVWLFALLLLVVPASLIVFLPIAPVWGYVVAGVLYIGTAGALIALSPVVAVTDGQLRAGHAAIDVQFLEPAEALDAEQSALALGRNFDARTYRCTVPWRRSLVRVRVADELDPTTAWLLSSRRPVELANAINASRVA